MARRKNVSRAVPAPPEQAVPPPPPAPVKRPRAHEAETEAVNELPIERINRPQAEIDARLLSDELDHAQAPGPVPAPAAPVAESAPASSLESLVDQLVSDSEAEASAEPAPPSPPPVHAPPAPAPEPVPVPATPPAVAAAPRAPAPPAGIDPALPAVPFLTSEGEDDGLLVLDDDEELSEASDLFAEPAAATEPSAPAPTDTGLADDDGFWERVMSPQEDAAVSAPPDLFAAAEGSPEDRMSAAEADQPTRAPAFEPEANPLAVEPAEAMAPESHAPAAEGPQPHVAVREGFLEGANALPVALDFDDDVDEITHAMAAFADLQFGQVGFIRFSLRRDQEFKGEAKAWLAARKVGVDPEEKDGKAKFGGWLRWFFGQYLVHYAMKKDGDRSPPPPSPTQRGKDLKPLPTSQVSEEEKGAWKAASRKALDSEHFEVALRLGVAGKSDDSSDLERQVDQVAAGFEIFSTLHQRLGFRPVDPYAALLGLMKTRRPNDVPIVLSAEEVAAMAHVPDDLTQPTGIRIRRSSFKQLSIPNPLTVPDPDNPPPGMIPIGIINPDSEDEKYIAIRNSELDKHGIIVGSTGSGKALALDTPIMTPAGETTMGALEAGDEVFGADGQPTRILAATEVMNERPCFEVIFSDGERIVADAEHLWVTRDVRTRASDSRARAHVRAPIAACEGAVEEISRGAGPLTARDAITAGVPPGAARAVTCRLSAVEHRAETMEQTYGEVAMIKRTTLPAFDRDQLVGALRRRLHDSRRDQGLHRLAPRERTTRELAASVRASDGRVNHSIDLPAPVEYPEQDLPVPAYTLGAWLGDGHSWSGQITSADPEVAEHIRADGFEVREVGTQVSKAKTYSILKLKVALREAGVLKPDGPKHIPEIYMCASIAQRWALLEGLLDSDGGVESGACRFYNTNKVLIEQVRELCFSLGLRPLLNQKRARLNGRDIGPSFTLSFTSSRPCFRLERKRALQNESARVRPRYITDVRPIDSVPVRCIQVEAEDGIFLAGRTYTPTHNSVFLVRLCYGVAKSNYPFVLVDPHGQFSDEVLNSLIVNCPERLDDVVFCDLSNEDFPVAFNPLDIRDRRQIAPTVGSIKEMLSSHMNLDGSGAPRAIQYAIQAVTALCHANLVLEDPNTKCTLLDVVPFFSQEDFRQMVVEFCDNEAVTQNFNLDTGNFANLSDKEKIAASQPIVRAFTTLANSDAFSAVFSSAQNKLNLGRLIGERKIVIIKLASFSYQAELGEFVGSLVLPWLLSSMDDWGRHKDEITREESGTGCRVFVDEAPTLYGPDSSVPTVLAQARKWDLGLISVCQSLTQFPQNVREEMLANTKAKWALASDPNVAGPIASAVAGASNLVSKSDIATLPNYHYYANVLLPAPGGGLAPSGPFSARCLPPMNDILSPEQVKIREQVIGRSRQLITNPIREIKAAQKNRRQQIMQALHVRISERVDSEFNPDEVDGGSVLYDEVSGDWT